MNFHKLDYRKISLFFTLILVVGLCLYRYRDLWLSPTEIPKPAVIVVEDRTASLPLDEETKAEIIHYFEGVRIPPEENNLDFAQNLESVGRLQLSRGSDEEAYSTYQRVLAISYQQGSLKGIGNALLTLSEVAERGDDRVEAQGAAMLSYKVVEAMPDNEEREVLERRLAQLLEGQGGIEMQMTGIQEEGAEEGSDLTTLASESEAATPPGSVSTDREALPATPAPPEPSSSPDQGNPRILQLADQIEAQVARFRGLPVGQPIVKTFARQQEIQKRLLELADELNPPGQVELEKKALVKLGLIPQSFDLAEFLGRISLLSTVSFYDPKTKTLYIDDSLTHLQDDEAIEKEILLSLAMNLVHALQDRHFNLTPYTIKVEGPDALDDTGVVNSIDLLGHIADVRGEDRIGHSQEGMIRWKRLYIEGFQSRSGNGALLERINECLLLHDRAPGGIDQISSRLHQIQLAGSDQTPRPLTQAQMNGYDIRLAKQALLVHQGSPTLSRSLLTQVLAPGHDIHLKGLTDPGHSRSNMAEP